MNDRDMKQLEEIAKKEKDEEKAKQKLYQQNSLQDPTKSKKTLKKRKKHKDQLDIDYNNFISKVFFFLIIKINLFFY